MGKKKKVKIKKPRNLPLHETMMGKKTGRHKTGHKKAPKREQTKERRDQADYY